MKVLRWGCSVVVVVVVVDLISKRRCQGNGGLVWSRLAWHVWQLQLFLDPKALEAGLSFPTFCTALLRVTAFLSLFDTLIPAGTFLVSLRIHPIAIATPKHIPQQLYNPRRNLKIARYAGLSPASGGEAEAESLQQSPRI
jgi:hypothetical protein